MGTLNLTRQGATLLVTGRAFNTYADLHINVSYARHAGPYRSYAVEANGPDWNSPATITFAISASQAEYIYRAIDYHKCGNGESLGTYKVFGYNNSTETINILDTGTINAIGLRECEEGEQPSEGESSGGEESGGGGGVSSSPAPPYDQAPTEENPINDLFGPRDSYGPLGGGTFTPGGGGPAGFG